MRLVGGATRPSDEGTRTAPVPGSYSYGQGQLSGFPQFVVLFSVPTPPARPTDLDTFLAGGWLEDACHHVQERARRQKRPGGAGSLYAPAVAAARIRAQIATGRWLPRMPRMLQLPKKRGGVREISLFDPEDQAVHSALQRFLAARLDPQFHPSSFGFRPRRSVGQAVGRAARLIDHGRSFAADLDIADCFGTIPHGLLFERLADLGVDDPPMTTFLRRLLNGSVRWPGRGLPQGSPLAPVLCNSYLHAVDVGVADPDGYLRYGDDLLCLCRTADDAAQALLGLRTAVEAGGQRTVPYKSGVTRVGEGWGFLGWRADASGTLRPPPRPPGARRR